MLELGRVLHILMHRCSLISQEKVVQRKHNTANDQEKTATSAFLLFVGPLDTVLGESEHVPHNRHHHQDLHHRKTYRNRLH